MPLNLYRLHASNCPHRKKGRSYRRCSCRIWAQGVTTDGRCLKVSLKTRSWSEAEVKARELDRGRARRIPRIEEAVKSFLEDLSRRRLSESVEGKFRRLLGRLEAAHPSARLDSITADDMRKFARSWGYAATTERAEIERLRQFWGFCEESGWVLRNPAKAVKPPKEPRPQVEPFTPEDMAAILAACDPMDRAFVLLMRYSGLRIGDVVHLEKNRIDGDRLMLRTTKNSVVVSVPLPPVVLQALQEFPHASERWFFWSGSSRRARNSWCNRLRRLFDRAGVEGAHSHRFRHTFISSLLLEGIPVTDVAALAGNSPQMIEKHYAAWIRARQEKLDQQVRQMWAGSKLDQKPFADHASH